MRDVSGAPITEFPLPDQVPDQIAAARDKFVELVAKRRAAHEDLNAANERAEHSRREDTEAVGRALANGDAAPKDPHKREREARARLDEARDQAATLDSAVDHALDNLGRAIEQARPAWLEELQSQGDAATARFQEAIKEAGSALDALAEASEITPWLASFGLWRLEPERGGHHAALFRRDLPEEIANAFSGLQAMGAVASSVDRSWRTNPATSKAIADAIKDQRAEPPVTTGNGDDAKQEEQPVPAAAHASASSPKGKAA